MDLAKHLHRRAAETATPTAAQAKAGNYRKGRVKAHGLPIAIENAAGSMRRGVGSDGKPWACKLPCHYGEISRTEGADGDPVDVFIGPHLRSKKVFVLDQNDADTGKFDEAKVFLGFASARHVLNVYRKAFSDGKADKRFGSLHEMTPDQLRSWLKDGDTTQPLRRAAGGRIHMDAGGALPRVYIPTSEPAALPDETDVDQNAQPGVLSHLTNRLFGLNGEPRYQLWPEKMVRSGFTLPGDVASGAEPMMKPGYRREDFTDQPEPGPDPSTFLGRNFGVNAQSWQPQDAAYERAQDTAGMAGGTSFGALDTSAATLGAGPVRRAAALPMDEASRMARAAEQGYTIDAYHGTNQPLDRFVKKTPSTATDFSATRSGTSDLGTWFTDDPGIAGSYAENAAKNLIPDSRAHQKEFLRLQKEVERTERARDWDANERAVQALEDHEYGAINAEPSGQNILPVKAALKNPLEIDARGGTMLDVDKAHGDVRELIKGAKKDGYDGVVFKNLNDNPTMGDMSVGTHYVVFDPKNIRSRFAKFDPSNKGKSGLLLSDSATPGAPIAALEHAPQFFSGVERAVEGIAQPKMTGDQWLGTLSNKPGVKPEELQWTGLADFLAGKKGQPVTKQEVMDHIAGNKVELQEVVRGGVDDVQKNPEWARAMAENNALTDEYHALHPSDGKRAAEISDLMNKNHDIMHSIENAVHEPTKYHGYQLPGGENYREMLMTLPTANENYIRFTDAMRTKYGDKPLGQMPMTEAERAYIDKQIGAYGDDGGAYKSSHWDEPNILAHMRMNDRTIDGKKSLHLEEIQSDWHQQGRDRGYRDPAVEAAIERLRANKQTDADITLLNEKLPHGTREYMMNGVPDAPFKKTWHELALKRALREAAEKGYDRLSWTPGEAQAARYDLSKQISDMKVVRSVGDGGNHYTIDATLKGRGNGDRTRIADGIPEGQLADHVGKEMAQKIVKDIDSAQNNRWGVKNKQSGNWSQRYNSREEAKAFQDSLPESVRGKTDVLEMTPKYAHEYSGLDLKVGGEGMKGFYDSIIPKALEKIGKEHGVKVQKGEIAAGVDKFDIEHTGSGWRVVDMSQNQGQGTFVGPIHRSGADAEKWLRETGRANTPVHYIDIPQSLRDQAMKRGFALFEDSAFTGAPLSAIEHMNQPFFKENVIRKKGEGIPVGKSAKGHNFKRPESKKGTWERAVAESRAGWQHDKSGILADYSEATNSLMKPEDWEFMRSGNFRARGGSVPHMADGGLLSDEDMGVGPVLSDADMGVEAKPAKPDAGAWSAAGRGAFQGATFNFGDEISGARAAAPEWVPEMVGPIPTKTIAGGARLAYDAVTGGSPDARKAYEETVAREREANKTAAEQHPWAYHGAEIAGSIPATVALPGGTAMRGASLANRVRQGATLGAEAGALSGAGEGEDAMGRLTGAGVGAGAGTVGGGLAAPVAEGAGLILKKTLGPVYNAVIGAVRGPENEAARRVFTALEADAADILAGKANGMTPQQWAAARAAGEPVTLAELGSARTQSLLRSSANTSPEGRGVLEKTIGDRFEGQAERVGKDVRNLVNGGANANKTADQLVAEYDVARVPAYRAAFNHPNAQGLWDGDFEQMARAPAVQEAIKMAAVNAKDEAAKLGLKPPANPFAFNKDGTVTLTDPNFTPNLQFWDVVKKNLDGGDRLSQQWSKILRGKLDSYGTGYDKARGIAAQFFGERDALEAGRTMAGKRVDPDVVAGLMRKMSPEERDLFREGHASDWAGRVIGNFRDSRDITKAMFNSPNERKMAEVIYGPAGVKKLEARMTLEAVMDGARRALGNSTTARQLIEAGLAGGAVAGYGSGWDPRSMIEGAGAAAGARKLLATEMAAGARKLIGKVDAKTAARVAELLTSDDPRKLAAGMRIMVANKRVSDGMRAIADRLGVATQNKTTPRVQIDTAGWGGALPARAEPDQQQNNPGGQ